MESQSGVTSGLATIHSQHESDAARAYHRMRIVSISGTRSHHNDAKGNRMVTVRLVHAWRNCERLLLVVLDMDDSSSTVRFASVANSRLRKIRDHCVGRADMGGVNPLALAHGEDASNFRIVHNPLRTLQNVPRFRVDEHLDLESSTDPPIFGATGAGAVEPSRTGLQSEAYQDSASDRVPVTSAPVTSWIGDNAFINSVTLPATITRKTMYKRLRSRSSPG